MEARVRDRLAGRMHHRASPAHTHRSRTPHKPPHDPAAGGDVLTRVAHNMCVGKGGRGRCFATTTSRVASGLRLESAPPRRMSRSVHPATPSCGHAASWWGAGCENDVIESTSQSRISWCRYPSRSSRWLGRMHLPQQQTLLFAFLWWQEDWTMCVAGGCHALSIHFTCSTAAVTQHSKGTYLLCTASMR